MKCDLLYIEYRLCKINVKYKCYMINNIKECIIFFNFCKFDIIKFL